MARYVRVRGPNGVEQGTAEDGRVVTGGGTEITPLDRDTMQLPEPYELLTPLAAIVLARGLDQAAVAQHAQVAAHRRFARAEGVGEVARAARALAQQIDNAAARAVGERGQRGVEAHCLGSPLLRMRCMKYQRWPSGSPAS